MFNRDVACATNNTVSLSIVKVYHMANSNTNGQHNDLIYKYVGEENIVVCDG
jgi:hypothetical protein